MHGHNEAIQSDIAHSQELSTIVAFSNNENNFSPAVMRQMKLPKKEMFQKIWNFSCKSQFSHKLKAMALVVVSAVRYKIIMLDIVH
jgi:hypothetical protein